MSTDPISAATDDNGLTQLCERMRSLIPAAHFGPEAWYLVPAAIIAQSPSPERLASLYTHLTITESVNPHKLSLRLRDLLLKQVPLIGAPQVLCALMPLAKADSDPAYGASTPAEAAAATKTTTVASEHGGLSANWRDIDVNAVHARGTRVIDSIYGDTLLPKIFESFGGHSADVQFMELFAVYGLYLSEFSQLSALETELVVWATINCTGLRGRRCGICVGWGGCWGREEGMRGAEGMRRVKDLLRDGKVAMMECVEWSGEEMVRRTGLDGGLDGRGWCNVGMS